MRFAKTGIREGKESINGEMSISSNMQPAFPQEPHKPEMDRLFDDKATFYKLNKGRDKFPV